jgi:hypothetical protein
MAATFVLTTASAIFVLGTQGISVHSETWQIATAWLTSVEVEAPTPAGRPTVETTGRAPFVTTVVASATPGNRQHGVTQHGVTHVSPSTAPSKAPSSAQSRRSELETVAKVDRNAVASGTRKALAADSVGHEGWWPWPTASDEQPYFGLGASGLR